MADQTPGAGEGGLSDERLVEMARALVALPGVVGVTLGGSRAQGTALPSSDVDLGIYVRGDLDHEALTRLARDWSSEPVTIGPHGSWGPWVDTGGWLSVDGQAVDWIVRDLDRVAEQVDRAGRGEFAFHVQPGHPLGFLDVAYAGELVTARVLADPTGALDDLRCRLPGYPPALSEALVGNLWHARFLVEVAAKGAKRADVAFVGVSLSHALMVCAHALHARAGVWVMNEKGLVPGIARLSWGGGSVSRSDEAGGQGDGVVLARRCAEVLGNLGSTPESLTQAIAAASQIVDEVETICR